MSNDNNFVPNGQLQNVNLNKQGVMGVYRLIGGCINGPVDFNGYGIMEVKYGTDNGYVIQEITQIVDSTKWVRSTTGSPSDVSEVIANWGKWERVSFSGVKSNVDIKNILDIKYKDYTILNIGSIVPSKAPYGGAAWSLLEYIPISDQYAKLVWTNWGSETNQGKKWETVIDSTNKKFVYDWLEIITDVELAGQESIGPWFDQKITSPIFEGILKARNIGYINNFNEIYLSASYIGPDISQYTIGGSSYIGELIKSLRPSKTTSVFAHVTAKYLDERRDETIITPLELRSNGDIYLHGVEKAMITNIVVYGMYKTK